MDKLLYGSTKAVRWIQYNLLKNDGKFHIHIPKKEVL